MGDHHCDDLRKAFTSEAAAKGYCEEENKNLDPDAHYSLEHVEIELDPTELRALAYKAVRLYADVNSCAAERFLDETFGKV